MVLLNAYPHRYFVAATYLMSAANEIVSPFPERLLL
jgi:hypothetical protein